MPVDDIDAGYQPDRPSTIDNSPTRVMRLEELPEKQQRKVKRALQAYNSTTDTQQAGITKSHNDWYNSWGGARSDFINSAQRAADNTRKQQTVHHHAHGLPCDGFDHTTVGPDLTRSTALKR